MSHTTAIKGIKIVNIEALENALAELNSKGIKCSLVPNAVPRAYFENQQGMGTAAYVIKLDDCAFDIGLYRDEENGGYEARTDFWEHTSRFGDKKSISALLGGTPTKAEYTEQAKMGRLFQTYGIHAAMYEARRQGKMVQRVEDESTGKVRLVVSGF